MSKVIKFLLIFLSFFPESSEEQRRESEAARLCSWAEAEKERIWRWWWGRRERERRKEDNPGGGSGSAKTRIRSLREAQRREGRPLYRVTHRGRAAGVRGGWTGRWRQLQRC